MVTVEQIYKLCCYYLIIRQLVENSLFSLLSHTIAQWAYLNVCIDTLGVHWVFVGAFGQHLAH